MCVCVCVVVVVVVCGCMYRSIFVPIHEGSELNPRCELIHVKMCMFVTDNRYEMHRHSGFSK